MKVDVIIAQGGGSSVSPGGQGAPPPDPSAAGAIYKSLMNDMAQIKTTEGNILHQVADLR